MKLLNVHVVNVRIMMCRLDIDCSIEGGHVMIYSIVLTRYLYANLEE